jgi:hypothetical protein
MWCGVLQILKMYAIQLQFSRCRQELMVRQAFHIRNERGSKQCYFERITSRIDSNWICLVITAQIIILPFNFILVNTYYFIS